MREPFRGDHSISTVSPRTSDGASSSTCPSLADVKSTPTAPACEKTSRTKTPSPKPSSVSSRNKTPSPTLANLSGRPFAVRVGSPKGVSSERTSPTHGKSSPSCERASPTHSKGSCSPTHSSSTRAAEGKSGRSASATAGLAPTPPSNGAPRRNCGSMIRSKSVASNPSDVLVASESKPRAARRPVETRDSSTQTLSDARAQTLAAEEAGISWELAAISQVAALKTVAAGDEESEGDGQKESWLDPFIRMQGALEMVLCSKMEQIAERMHSLPPQPMPPDGQPPPGTRRPGTRHALPRDELPSDGEGHEDDEVRSLSLSEDGPVIRRPHSATIASLDRSRAAPDPIAMLSDGDLSALPAFREHVDAAEHDSDRSGATTQLALAAEEPSSAEYAGAASPPHGASSPPGDYAHVFERLTPLLSKMACHLEVVLENADAHTELARARSEGGVKVPTTRVRAMRCSASVESLNLSEVHLHKHAETRPQSARSDVSFGSASSAFTCLSSSTSGSHPLSPDLRARRSLTGTVSMPSLPQSRHR
ncbi:hypothetical protein AB1Y20_016593 [Prymnesium parvum]|uniref:Uncharacterized protein n=1 Tax=Prymnesium parvum TaxID=97485 RepID=A0AB34ID66_PRYPA